MPNIPCPRLEFRWTKTGEDWLKRICTYSLVIPLSKYDMRREDEDGIRVSEEFALEIGSTQVDGGDGSVPIDNGEVDTPFRDGAHARWDRKALGGHIPIVAVCGNEWSLVEIVPDTE